MAQIAKIVIDEDGNVSIDLNGYKGKGCHAVQEIFTKALGTSTKDVTKAEYNQTCTNKVRVGGQ